MGRKADTQARPGRLVNLRAVFRNLLFLYFPSLLSLTSALGAGLNGLVLDQERRDPIPNAVIYLGETARTESDSLGRFRIEGLAPGETILRIEHIGYQPWSRRIVLVEKRPFEVTVRLRSRIQTLETVEVGAPRPDPSVPQGKETITPTHIRKAAGAVATDLLRVVQALPGSAAAGDDFSDRYVVRGGDPEENTVVFDGYTVLHPVHLEGFTSVIYDDLVGGVEVYPGALPPRFGDALSSVTDLAPLRPEKRLGFFRYDLGSIALGGQVSKADVTAIGAARTSFYNLIVRRPPGVDHRSFRDLTAKVSSGSAGGIETSFTLMGSRDRESGDVTRSIDDYLLGARTGRSAGAWQWHVSGSAAESQREMKSYRSPFEPPEETRGDFRRATLGMDLLWRQGSNVQIRTDMEGREDRFKGNHTPRSAPGGYFSAEGTWSGSRGAASIGARMERINFTRGTAVSPYVSVRFRGAGRFVPGLAWRIVRQSPFSLIMAPEIAGLPLDPETLLESGRDRLPPMQATHLSGSCDISLGRGFSGGVQGYRKQYSRLLTWKDPSKPLVDVEASGTGTGTGASVLLRRDGGGATGYISYTFSKTRKREGPATSLRPADYDQPEMLQASIEVPLHGGTGMSIAYRASSGRPITRLAALPDGDLVLAGEINGDRLPSYRRLDAKLEHRTSGKSNAFLYLDVLNLTNRLNVVDIVQFVGTGQQIVRIPTQGVRILPVAGFGFYF